MNDTIFLANMYAIILPRHYTTGWVWLADRDETEPI